MGNGESSQTNSDGEENTYNYHKSVLKEGASPVTSSKQRLTASLKNDLPEYTPETGSRPEGSTFGGDTSQEDFTSRQGAPHLPETPESSNESFVDANEDLSDDESNGKEDSCLKSCDSSLSPSASCSGSMDRSSGSYSSHSSWTSSDQTINRSSSSSSSLPNRIRIIDTSESEGDDVDIITMKKHTSQAATPASSNHGDKKHLPRPIPVHRITTGSETMSRSDDTSASNKQVKRKADDMDPESDPEENPTMTVPVRKSGGVNRLWARRKELRDMVLGPQMPKKTVSAQQTSEEPEDDEEMVVATTSAADHNSDEDQRNKFEHSNTSPFTNFRFQPSSSSAGAELSASAETPKERTVVPEDDPKSSPLTKQGMKRANPDADPSSGSVGKESSSAIKPLSQKFDMFERTPGTSSGTVEQITTRVLAQRGNSGQSAGPSETSAGGSVGGSRNGKTNGAAETSRSSLLQDRMTDPNHHWTSQLPRVNTSAEQRFQASSRTSVEPSTSDWHTTTLKNKGDKFSFLLADETNVHICYDDITALRTDALINPTDGQLTHVNETARAVAMAAGPLMIEQCRFFLRQHGGPLETTEVVETYASGSLSGRVGHIVQLAMPMYQSANEKESTNKLLKSYLNCLNHVNDKLGLQSATFPCIGAGSFPQDTCINVFFEALLVHLAERKTSSLKVVKFVLNNEHLGNFAIAMIQAHLERIIIEGIDTLTAEAMNSYYGNSRFECCQNDINDRLGRQMEVDSPKKMFRGPPVKRPRL
ncbi:serine-rich adhesin for platelets-like [Haliotis asinina]|uniref:serine-rich adhesin for platelets-like n=1 Tax=Haliotis asinina TaxID=109174 RepID=UPI003531802C